MQNRAQPFLKVTLSAGASIVSVDVAGEAAKPVQGADGTRVPLLRPGFRPSGSYAVTFVYLHAGTPFAKKGEMQMTLPKMDIPVGIVEWEAFVPDNYSVRAFDGNVIDRRSMVPAYNSEGMKDGIGTGVGSGLGPGAAGGVAEHVTVTATGEAAVVDQSSARAAQKSVEPSQNVVNLQRRAAGVLPVRVDVPRAGTSHQFVKPLVVDQEAVVNFRYNGGDPTINAEHAESAEIKISACSAVSAFNRRGEQLPAGVVREIGARCRW